MGKWKLACRGEPERASAVCLHMLMSVQKLPLASDSERFAGAYHHVIHVLHYRTTENFYTLSSSPSYLCRAEALGLSLTVIQ